MKDAANMNSPFRLMRMQKSSGAKCSLSRRELYKKWFARFGSKVRKMNDQKLTQRRRISKVTHSRKQWTEIEVGKFEFDIPAIC